jgi:hypothetical protein
LYVFMENTKKIMRELYELYLELGHEVFEEKIKKPMELYYLHNTHDSGNVISMSSLNTFDANDMQSHKLGDTMFYEDDLFSPPSFDEEIYFDDTLPPIYDDYCDDTYAIKNKFLQVDHDKNDSCDSYFVEFAPTTIDDFAYVGSNKFSMLMDHDKNFLCDTYIVEFIHDPTENYYERGTYAYRYFNNIKFPLFMLKVLKLHMFCLPMLIALCFNELFYCNIPMDRKHVRLKCVWYLLLDALFCSSTLIPTRASLKS